VSFFLSIPLTLYLRTKGTVLLYKESEYNKSFKHGSQIPRNKNSSHSYQYFGPSSRGCSTLLSDHSITLYVAILQFKPLYLWVYFVAFNIYIYDETDKIWEVKGYYQQVVKDNDKVQFTPHDVYGHFLRILIVSSTFLPCVLSFYKHFYNTSSPNFRCYLVGIPKDVAINLTYHYCI
jgi:hypothetical protein